MKCFNILIDIDDTITDTGDILFEYMEEDGRIDLTDPKNNKIDIMKGKITCPELLEFYTEYALTIAKNVQLKPGVVNSLKFLKKRKFKIHFVSSRIKPMYKETKKYFRKNRIPYDYLSICVSDKKSYCIDNNIHIAIDDSIENCSALINTKTIPILFTSRVNKDIQTDIIRIDKWDECLLNEKIENLIKEIQKI